MMRIYVTSASVVKGRTVLSWRTFGPFATACVCIGCIQLAAQNLAAKYLPTRQYRVNGRPRFPKMADDITVYTVTVRPLAPGSAANSLDEVFTPLILNSDPET
jgi:hypothetical protein